MSFSESWSGFLVSACRCCPFLPRPRSRRTLLPEQWSKGPSSSPAARPVVLCYCLWSYARPIPRLFLLSSHNSFRSLAFRWTISIFPPPVSLFLPPYLYVYFLSSGREIPRVTTIDPSPRSLFFPFFPFLSKKLSHGNDFKFFPLSMRDTDRNARFIREHNAIIKVCTLIFFSFFFFLPADSRVVNPTIIWNTFFNVVTQHRVCVKRIYDP